MGNNVSSIVGLCTAIGSRNIIEASKLLEGAEKAGNELVRVITMQVIRNEMAVSKLLLDKLLSNSHWIDILRQQATFKIEDYPIEKAELERIVTQAREEFAFLPDRSLEYVAKEMFYALNEFDKMSFSSFCHSESNGQVVAYLHRKERSFADTESLLSEMVSLPFGFHLCELAHSDNIFYSDPVFRKSRILVSNQKDGVYFAKFSVKKEQTISLNKFYTFIHDFFQYDRDERDSQVPVTTGNDDVLEYKYSPSVLYRLSFLCYLVANQHNSIFTREKKVKIAALRGESKSNYLVKREGLAVIRDQVMPEDILFSGDYECLSFLDDLYKDTLLGNLDILNYKESLEVGHATELRYDRDAVSINDIKTKVYDMLNNSSGIIRSSSLISVIPDVVFDNDDPLSRVNRIAIFNKMALLSMYIGHDYKSMHEKSIVGFTNMALTCPDMVLSIATDKPYVNYLGISNSNLGFFKSSERAFMSLVPGQRDDIKGMRSYDQKTKAYKVIILSITSYDELLRLTGASCLADFTGDMATHAKMFYADKILNEIAESKNMKRTTSFYFDRESSEPELLNIWGFAADFSIMIPVTKKQFELLCEQTKLVEENI